jgi:hypothetical protein
MLCISIIALFVMVIWFYAISIILPYIVHDQKELSVWQALKRNFYEDLRADKELSEPETTDIIQSV